VADQVHDNAQPLGVLGARRSHTRQSVRENGRVTVDCGTATD
jgi:hypothetical protein